MKKKEKRKKGRKEQYYGKQTRCFVVTADDWTIKLQGEISSDCPERNLVTAAGPRERERSV